MNDPKTHTSSTREILLFSPEEEEKDDRKLVLRLRYFSTLSQGINVVVVGSSLDSSAAGSSSSLLNERMCMKNSKEQRSRSRAKSTIESKEHYREQRSRSSTRASN
jgi:hypothetical protein